MFVRTISGLLNRAAFTRTNYTVYVEGGGGISGAGSPDALFWGDLLTAHRPDLKFTVKPHGGKPELETMAEKVRAGTVSHTLVAMDADYDALLGDLITHPNVLYTYGYSWENDAFDPEHLKDALTRLLKGQEVCDEAVESVKSVVGLRLSALTLWINADFWLRSMKSSLFPKLNPGRYIGNSAVDKEVQVKLNALWCACRRQLKMVPEPQKKKRPPIWIITGQHFLQGHAMQFLMKCALKFAMATLGKKSLNMSDDYVESVMMRVFCDRVGRRDDHLSEHYLRQLHGLS